MLFMSNELSANYKLNKVLGFLGQVSIDTHLKTQDMQMMRVG